MLKVIRSFEAFNKRRYSNPWVAIVGADARLDFSQKCGGYTGGYGKGEAGELYVIDPIDGQVYGFGQKDYRGNNGFTSYAQYKGGEFVHVAKCDLVRVLNEMECPQ